MFLLQRSYYGELLVPAPCWFSSIPQANTMSAKKVVLLPTSYDNRWRILAEDLWRTLRRNLI